MELLSYISKGLFLAKKRLKGILLLFHADIKFILSPKEMVMDID